MFLRFSQLLVLHAGGTRRGGLLAGSCQDTSGVELAVIRWSVFVWLFAGELQEISSVAMCIQLCSIAFNCHSHWFPWQVFLDTTPLPALQHPFCAYRYVQKMCNAFGKKAADAASYVFTPVTLPTYKYKYWIVCLGFVFHSIQCFDRPPGSVSRWRMLLCLKVNGCALPHAQWMATCVVWLLKPKPD